MILRNMILRNILVMLSIAVCCLLSPVSGQDDAVCALCPVNMYCSSQGVVECPTNTSSLVGSHSINDCSCKMGYTGPNGGPCTACSAGSFKKIPGYPCLPCPQGTSSGTGSASCTGCPANMVPDVDDVSRCSCKEGYGLSVEGDCQACASGDFKGIVGNLTCTPCPIGAFSNQVAATECTTCLENEVTQTTGSSECTCAVAYSRNGSASTDTCTACPRGTVKDVIGEMQCVECAVGWYAPSEAGLECLACPSHMTTLGPGASSCVCTAAYGFNASTARCDICTAGTYQNTTRNVSCTPCPVSEVSAEGSVQCSACAAHMHTLTDGVAPCECMPGYEMLAPDSGLCTSCAAGHYKAGTGNYHCSACEDNTYTAGVASTTCSACVSNSQTTEPAATFCVCVQGYELDLESAACECAKGYEIDLGLTGLCTPCSVNTFKDTTGNDTCSRCQKTGTTPSSAQDGLDMCVCGAGFGYNATTAVCSSCESAFFKKNIGNDACVEKQNAGIYILFRLVVSISDFSETLQQTVLDIVANIVGVQSAIVTILDIQDLSLLNNANARRLLTESNVSLVVEIFVNDSTANTTLLTDVVVNDHLATQAATAGLSVSLEEVERRSSLVDVTTPTPTSSPAPTPTPGLPRWALIVVIIFGAVIFISGVLISIYYCVIGRGTTVVAEPSRMVATYHGPQRELVYQVVSYPNANASPARNLDISHFFEFSKRLHSPDSVHAN
jgi:hypothetical protein